MQEHQGPGEETEEETAEGEGPEAPEALPPPALGHGTTSKESAQNRGATQKSFTDRLRSFFRR